MAVHGGNQGGKRIDYNWGVKKWIVIGVVFWLTTGRVLAAECENRYATVVNPVRSRERWVVNSLEPLKDQYGVIEKNEIRATWLLQYGVLGDDKVVEEIKKFKNQELGLFLEVDESLARDSAVIYDKFRPWYDPGVVFLSAYTRSERTKMVMEMFEKFRQVFGYYPRSVGGWWIDSYSLEVMIKKYEVEAAMIVADQKTTDGYGVFGQWWGVPYYPSKANILVPAQEEKEKAGVVMIQWAQRDLEKAYGEGVVFSNNSLQANDYLFLGKNYGYFSDTADKYLDCKNRLGQITVGLETGMESVGREKEYEKQLRYVKEKTEAVTMDEFADNYKKVFSGLNEKTTLEGKTSSWVMEIGGRKNEGLGDGVKYQNRIAFSDYFLADKKNFLDRIIDDKPRKEGRNIWDVGLITGLLALTAMKVSRWRRPIVYGLIWGGAAWGWILRSEIKYGWRVWWGPELKYPELTRVVLMLLLPLVGWVYLKTGKLLFGKGARGWTILGGAMAAVWLWYFRVSKIGDQYLVGALNDLRFWGLAIGKGLEWRNQEMEGYLAGSLLKFNWERWRESAVWGMIVWPAVWLLVGLGVNFVWLKLPKRIRGVLAGLVLVMTGWWIMLVLKMDPRAVSEIR